jgi:chromate reductase, NAD(P)H dehydrogenase (quinone)
MQILAISGSLRAESSNTILLSAARVLAPVGIEIRLFVGLGDLPHFNPDLDHDQGPPEVERYRALLHKSAGVILSAPEYAHGVPGVLKNALDWVVRSGELYEKPVALFNASPRARHAQASLIATLAVMTARLITAAFLTVPLIGRNLEETDILSDPELSTAIRAALEGFATVIADEGTAQVTSTDTVGDRRAQ